ncbi:HK97 family phage prohead protease [Microbacterium aurantiacum]|uniref:HK97 family phage prohead protease n=1 Tax=Microbacterium aurantiacum TaxID=162393 RepID=UPI0034339AB7
MKIKSVPVTFKAGPEDGLAEGEFIVYPSTFTRTPDAYGDVVAKGAFQRGIDRRKAAGIVLPGLFGHRMDDPDFYVASAIEESEDDHGWRVKGAFDLESPKGPQTYRLVKSGRLRELSFAYEVLDAGTVKLDDGADAYELRDLDVFEFSFVPVGANRDTSVVAVKSAVDALAAGLKSGRVLSAKNEETLRSVVETLGATVSDIKSVLSQVGAGEDQEKAGGQAEVKDEGVGDVKSEDIGVNPSRRALAVNQYIQSL